ncbi:GDP-mannose-dependent alpha-(1-6)-phosphatidylinositol monomannoside mannosyltransferase [Roseimaritima ulvae]|uniref:GDP-mannose-dependent alpha-(1-6)-phosphatidylinositol monomannoside mannosyltransferase n=2 Tax=Roseimaritima ulvae TaxID=980254 RepID=A0A5B9QNR6_9BACT|nr:GDP-mannose-dependent alpha-(1-6)-phosphatidylinositol monomannoside mannosyltransferase [Roseimaritima ulvae]
MASRLRGLPSGPWKRFTRPMASVAHRVTWRRFIDRSSVQLLHVQFGDKAVRLLPMLNRASLPLVVTFRGSDINCASYSEIRRHGLRKLFARASLCHFVSHDLRRKAIELGCPSEIARTIHVGAPPHAAHQLSRPTSRIEDCQFYCVASLLPCKGHETLLTAFRDVRKEIPNATLHLVGDGPLRDRLQWVCDSLQLGGRVIFHGHLDNEVVISKLRDDADVVVLTSQHDDEGNQEGLPTSLQEAASLGLPCIGTDCGGISELICNGETGLVVPQRDPARVAEALLQLAKSPRLRAEMGSAAALRGREHFNLENFYVQIAACYREAIYGEPVVAPSAENSGTHSVSV